MTDFDDVDEFLEDNNKHMEMTPKRLNQHRKAQKNDGYDQEGERLGRVLVLPNPAIGRVYGAQVPDALAKFLENEPPIEDIVVSDPYVYTPRTRSKVKRKDAKLALRDEIYDVEFPDLDEAEVTDRMRMKKYTKQYIQKLEEGIKNATPSGYRDCNLHVVLGEHAKNQMHDLLESKVQAYKKDMKDIQRKLAEKEEAKEKKQEQLDETIEDLEEFLEGEEIQNSEHVIEDLREGNYDEVDLEEVDEAGETVNQVNKLVQSIQELSESVEDLYDHYREEEKNLQEMKRQKDSYNLQKINNTYMTSSKEEQDLLERTFSEYAEEIHNLGNVKNILVDGEIEVKGKKIHLVNNNRRTDNPVKSALDDLKKEYEGDADIVIELYHGPFKFEAQRKERGGTDNTIFIETGDLHNPEGLEEMISKDAKSPKDVVRYMKYDGDLFSPSALILEWDNDDQYRLRELELGYLLNLQEAIEEGDDEKVQEYLEAKNPLKPDEEEHAEENDGEWTDVVGDLHIGCNHSKTLWNKPSSDAMAKAELEWIEKNGYPDNLVLTGDIVDGTHTYPGHSNSPNTLAPSEVDDLLNLVDDFASELPEEEEEEYRDFAQRYIAKFSSRAAGLDNRDQQMEEVKTDLIPKWNEIREQGGKIIIASGDHHNRSDRHRASEEALAIRSMFPKPEEGGSHKENIEVITGEGSGGGFETTSKGSDIFVSHAVSGGRYDAAQNAISHFENIKREYARLNVSGDDHKLAGGSVYKGTDEDGNPEFMKILRNAGAQPSINLLPKIGALDSPRGFIRAYDDEEHGYTEYHPVLDEQLTSRALGIFMDEGR